MKLSLKRFLAAASCAAALAVGPARAGDTPLRANIWQGAAVTTSSQVIIGPGSILPSPVTALSVFLYLENTSASATICISFGAAATISGSQCAAGEITLTPGAFRFFDTAVPTGTIYAIGSAAGSLTVAAQ